MRQNKKAPTTCPPLRSSIRRKMKETPTSAASKKLVSTRVQQNRKIANPKKIADTGVDVSWRNGSPY
jgi:hypothetical protein